jgi:transposase
MNNADSIEQKYGELQAKYALLLEQNQRESKQYQNQIEQHQSQVKQQQSQLKKHQSQIESQQIELKQQEQLIQQQQSKITTYETEIAYLQERLNILLSKRYQAQSEQLKAIQGQLFDEAELEHEIAETRRAIEALRSEMDQQAGTQTKPQQKPKRRPLPSHLRRFEVEIDVSDEDKQAMGEDWTCIGHETSEQLAVVQREYYVKVIKRKKYVRNRSEYDEQTPGIRVAPAAKVILPRSLADASFLADVLTSKFVDAVSFYRTEKRLSREGIDIGYSTLCDWPIQLHERLKPLKQLFYQALSQGTLWHLDETTLQVLGEPGKANRSNSYLWGIRAGPPDQPKVLFHYDSRRSYEALEAWLRPCLDDFQGVIITDEHAPYNKLVNQYPQIQAHGGCLAHCRRKFADAAKGRKDSSEAHKAVKLIAMIYAQERKIAHLSGAALVEARQQFVAPQMQRLKTFLDERVERYADKGAMKTAMGYALNNWHNFTAFLSHADLPIDNNPMEQAIRPFTLGRKNWLFAGSPKGADASAFIYSLIESAKANDLEPKRYLKELFERYPLAASDEERKLLLPWYFEFSK